MLYRQRAAGLLDCQVSEDTAMRPTALLCFVTFTSGALTSAAFAQSRMLINDRTSDAIMRGVDTDSNLIIDDATEVNVWFDATNAPGTLAPMNPTCLAISGAAGVAMGDQGNRVVYFLQDVNCDGDAQDIGESIIYADATNASGVSFAFPTGAEFGIDGALYIVNAGNAFGDDGIYRLVDLTGDGDAQDPGEITTYVGAGAFGAGNGPYAPQKILFDDDGVGYLRNSSSNLHGVYRFEDVDSSGNADDPGEFTVFWDVNNADNTPATAGFALEWDRARTSAMYTLQLASGGVDQLVRLHDLNGDDDAQDAGESAIVWSTSESGFTSVDVICLDNGDVLVTDNSGNRIIRLTDANGDGDFMDANERFDYLPNPGGTLAAVRQAYLARIVGDVVEDGVVNVFDLVELLSNWNTPGPGDVDGDGIVNIFDLLLLLSNWNACL